MVFNKGWWEQGVSPTALLKELGWEPLAERRKKQRLTMLYKISYGLIAVPPTRLIQPSRTTRGHTQKLQVIHTTIERVRQSFYPRTIPQWNKLSEEAVKSESLEVFKTKI